MQKASESRKNRLNEEYKRNILFHIGDSNSLLGKYKEAEEIHWETLELKEKVLGREYPVTLGSMKNLADVDDGQ
ncbi:uncharacterized protein BCR38DRAFT_421944 [Pseudomassariella vexata]|uniref:Tetratricopeptide repeat protein n=1 Tax=Pseudomassariella vexata TaxID=1141098 RepID=A0A1Y2EFZ9_9PEZI|nr:uncharacterized protein BCR38DRAFT_421812 [Pseudomassariella vexata]XP_040720343.1 uncharacterized protein BCR38DRAFT_421944 [Pseudomassariella vexata]ORY70347.1 hypothetical protein BCR38DRAFT_421812 [Pseudomassariella vexata]ORY70393.1 hypothetical protein BCR38DRAFT_421944 [Pseudomassariella vexata]